ncbi:MAG TPA: hypothetical protein P5567_11405 [Kiritimatiellia bacterium]|nr:hypothetical protein [Kiritimatiellia bacterium]HSA17466.1 hypothetical protein [Kiritimatiellia bacterium]
MSRLLPNWRGGYQPDDQRKAMFARLRGGGGGGGSDSGRSYDSRVTMHPSTYKGQTPEQAAEQLDRSIPEILSDTASYLYEGFFPGMSSDDVYALASAFPGGVILGAGSEAAGALRAAGRMTPKLKAFLRSLAVFGGALGTGQAVGYYRDQNPTMNPRTDHWLALVQDAANTVAALSGLKLARIGIGSLPGMSRLGEALGAAGSKIKAAQAAVADKTPGVIKTPLGWVAKAYNAVAGFTGAEVEQFSELPGALKKYQLSQGLTARAAELRSQAEKIVRLAQSQHDWIKWKSHEILGTSHKGARAFWPSAERMYREGAEKFFAAEAGLAGSGRSAGQLVSLAGKLDAKAAGLKKDAIGALARATYVAAGGTAVHTVEQGIKDNYRRDMERAFAQGQPFILNPDQDVTDTPLKRAVMFATGTLGNPVEKQTRFYVGGKYTKDLAERAYQEYQYDAIEAARAAGQITPKEAERLQVERAKQKPFNMAGKSLHSFTPAIAGFGKFAASTVSKAIKYRDPSELRALYNPNQLAGVGLMAYGNTVGGKLPSSIPISWNAFLAGQGVYQAYKQGPKNWRGKVFKPLQLE